MRIVAIAMVLVACADDPTLAVEVHHPLTVASTTVTVYESAVFDCEKIEFSELAPDELAAAQVAEVTIDAQGGSGKLSNVSRTDKKVIVARGFDSNQALISIGCAEEMEISGREKVTITTNIAGTASIGMAQEAGGTDQFAIMLAATEPDGKTLEGRPVSWTVYGPSGSQPYVTTNLDVGDAEWRPTRPSCTTNGFTKLHPVPPSLIGGYAVQVRLAWAAQLPPRVSLLTNIDLSLNPLVVGAAPKYCTTRISGSIHRLVCLDGTSARDYSVTVVGGVGKLALSQSQPLPAGNGTPLGVFSVAAGNDRDAYAITDTGFLIPLFGAQAVNNVAPALICGVIPSCVDDFLVAPACDVPAKLVLHTKRAGANEVEAMPVRGGNPIDFPTSAGIGDTVHLNNAGCVTELDPGGGTPASRQMVAVDIGKLTTIFAPTKTEATFCTATCQSLNLAAGAGVGFTDGGEPRIIATTVDATGVVLSQLVLAPDKAGMARFVERNRIPAAAVPEHVVVGQLDADHDADVLWSASAKRGNSSTFEVSYARTIDGQPLEALSAGRGIAVDDLQIGDLTGDGVDDVIVLGSDGTRSGVAVVPMGVPPPPVTLMSDSTCNP